MMPFPPKRILVPMDFSPPSFAGLEVAESLALRWNASLDLVYVEQGGVPRAPREALRRAVSKVLPARVRARVLTGWPPAVLAELTRAEPLGLAVMGTHGCTGIERALLGSVTEAVVRRAAVPVLTVHRESAPFDASKILVPLNMESYADEALRYALKFAGALDARVSVLYVAPPGSVQKESERLLHRHLELTLGETRASMIAPLVRQGEARPLILEEAARGGYGLIALSAHHRPLLGDLVLGSTAQRVLRRTTIPVLSVPSEEPERAEAFAPAQWAAGKIF